MMEKWENEKEGLNEIWGRRGRVDKGIQGRVQTLKAFWNSHMETYYCKNFLRYILIYINICVLV